MRRYLLSLPQNTVIAVSPSAKSTRLIPSTPKSKLPQPNHSAASAVAVGPRLLGRARPHRLGRACTSPRSGGRIPSLERPRTCCAPPTEYGTHVTALNTNLRVREPADPAPLLAPFVSSLVLLVPLRRCASRTSIIQSKGNPSYGCDVEVERWRVLSSSFPGSVESARSTSPPSAVSKTLAAAVLLFRLLRSITPVCLFPLLSISLRSIRCYSEPYPRSIYLKSPEIWGLTLPLVGDGKEGQS